MNTPGSPSSPEQSVRRSSPVQPGEEVAGKYRVDRVLGAGAMGVVVRAFHIDLEQEVAIKFLHPELAVRADSAERFRREACAAARIPSEHVPKVLDAGSLEGSNIPFIVMEYLQGRDLARELAARGSFSMREAARYVLEACKAVGEAHAQGIVHRDLKPANLFLADGPGGTQMIKVLDFGISKTLGMGTGALSITEPATLMGSPGYMSPEQLESSRNVDARTDIWSLGIILFELVTRSLPFDGESVPQLIRSVISGKRARLDELAPELAPLERVVARCLQQERARRFQNISELSDALAPLSPKLAEREFGAGPTSAAGSARGELSDGAPSGMRREREAVPDSAWGWTHAIRQSSLGRTLVLAVLLGICGAIVIGQGRKALRAAFEGSTAEELGRLEAPRGEAPELVPAPSVPPSRAGPGTTPGAGVELRVTPTQPPIAPAPPPPSTAPVPKQEAGTRSPISAPNPSPRPSPPAATPAAPPKAARPSEASAKISDDKINDVKVTDVNVTDIAPARGTERRAPPARDPYEIEEFGGRE